MAYTNTWTTAAPLDTQAANQGAVDFRATKLDVMQRIASFGAGVIANRPTPEATSATADWTGVMYWATDTQQAFRWNGSSWDDITSSIGSSIASALGTTGAPVNVNLAAPPTANQVLAASDATHATWITPTLTAGANVTVTGTWPAWTVAVPSSNFIGIVKSVDLAVEAAAIAATTLYSVPTTVLYRVTIDAVCDSAGSGAPSVVTPKVTWDNGSIASPQTVSLDTVATDLIGHENILVNNITNSITIYCKTGTVIQYSTTIANIADIGTYALHMRVEFLG